MNLKIEAHQSNRNIGLAIERIDSWDIPTTVKDDIKNFIKDLGLGKVNLGKKANERTQVKYIDLLKSPLIYFNKPNNKLALKDIEDYEKALSSGEVKSHLKDKAYSQNTQVNIKTALKVFLKWKLGPTDAVKLVGWLDTRDISKTPDYLKENEILKLYRACKSAKERYLIAVLFDSGCRAEEFLNIRYEDIELPTKDKNFVLITLKEEYSKTNGRVISLYWENSLEAVKEFLEERKYEGIKSNEQVFKDNYDCMRMFLSRLGKRAIDKNVHPHLFRHSSATHYASKLNRQQLCYRYGWAFSSDMPDVYISRAGMNNKEIDDKFESTELGELKIKLSKEEFERKKVQEDLIKMQLEHQAKEVEYTRKMEEVAAKMEQFEKKMEAQGKIVK